MALSKKHFEFIAASIRGEHPDHYEGGAQFTDAEKSAQRVALRNVAGELCVHFRRENPNFDGSRFLRACGF